MAGRMPRRGHDTYPRPRLGLALDLLERGAGKIRDMWKLGVVILLPGVGELALLHEDRGPRVMAIAASVFCVDVAVCDGFHFVCAMVSGSMCYVGRQHG